MKLILASLAVAYFLVSPVIADGLDRDGLLTPGQPEYIEENMQGLGLYKGYVYEGYFHGYGELQRENGTNFKGEWLLGYPHGPGEEWSSNGCYRFMGNFYNGAPEGEITLVVVDKYKVKMNMHHGVPDQEALCDCGNSKFSCSLAQFGTQCIGPAIESGNIPGDCPSFFENLLFER